VAALTADPDSEGRRPISKKEAGAAVVTANQLGWLAFQTK
jgi:hypothetical protein